MLARLTVILLFFGVFAIGTSQSLFRNITVQDTCESAVRKVRSWSDFRLERNEECYRNTSSPDGLIASIGGVLSYLFGQHSVQVDISFGGQGGTANAMNLQVYGSVHGLPFIKSAIEGFRAQKGEPLLYNPVDESSSRYRQKAEVIAEWREGSGVSIKIYYGGDFLYSGRIYVRFEPQILRPSPAQDAEQF